MSFRSFVAGLFLIAGAARAQSPAQHIALGDSMYAQFKPDEALPHYLAAIGADSSNAEALWKAARSDVDLAEAEKDEGRRDRFSKAGEALARRSIRVNAQDADAHFTLARALGRRALTLGVRDRIKYATDVRSEALEALRLNPNHPGALHVMGVWNAEVMRLNGVTRLIARKWLGGKVLETASWAEAVRYMDLSVAAEPTRLVHRLDQARVYRDVGRKDDARKAYEAAIALPLSDANDDIYKKTAEDELKKLGR